DPSLPGDRRDAPALLPRRVPRDRDPAARSRHAGRQPRLARARLGRRHDPDRMPPRRRPAAARARHGRAPPHGAAAARQGREAPLLANPAWLARLVRTPVAPLTPTLVVPLPVKYRIHYGAPLRFRGPPAPDAVARHVAEVRAAVQELIRRGLRLRRHVFF